LVWDVKIPTVSSPESFYKYRASLQAAPSFYKTDLPMALAYKGKLDLCMPRNNPPLEAKATQDVKNRIMQIIDNNYEKQKCDIVTLIWESLDVQRHLLASSLHNRDTVSTLKLQIHVLIALSCAH
jgi:hypothetical protein